MNIKTVDVTMGQLSPLMLSLLAEGTDIELTATGNSMRPLWHHRKDVVRLSAICVDDIKKWDVLLYTRADGSFVLHRVVKIGEKTLDFLGDAQFLVEKNVPKENVVAKAVGHKRGGGKYRNLDGFGYKLYVFLWYNSRGIRYFFYRVYRKILKVFGAKK